MSNDQNLRQPPLNGWKEIAGYLGKSVRSVQRWEATLGLPVRRIRTAEGQIVYADRDEIEQWRRRLDAPPTPVPEDPRDPESMPEVAEAVPAPADHRSYPAAPAEATVSSAAAVTDIVRPKRERWALLAGGAALIAMGIFTGWLLFRPTPVTVKVILAGQALQGLSPDGTVLWTHAFARDVRGAAEGSPDPMLVDLNGAGTSTWLVPVRFSPPGELPATSDTLVALSREGELLWMIQPDQVLTYPNRTMSAPWYLTDVAVSPDLPRRVWVSFAHNTGGSSFVLEVGGDGASKLRYVQFGRIHTVAHWQTPGGGVLAAAGASDEHRQATLALMPENDQPATYPIDNPARATCTECPANAPTHMYLFPKSELTVAAHETHPYVVALNEVGAALEVRTYQGEGHALFMLNPDFTVASWQMTETYWGAHKELELRGRLDHPAEACPDRFSPKTIREWRPGAGWREFDVPPGPARPATANGLQPAVTRGSR